MTYFDFLFRFLAIPIMVLLAIASWDMRRGKALNGFQSQWAVWIAIGLLALLAVLYTTPWDNYLVATGVWNYNLRLVSGLVIGWVPLEEYTFFVLETLLTGLWWGFLARRVTAPAKYQPSKRIRTFSLAVLGLVWLGSIFILILGWAPETYLALILAWGLPAIAPQLAFGADILWHHRKLVSLTVFPMFFYFSAADLLAIASGTWTIDPRQSMSILIGTLPLEEAIFFWITVTLLAFGLTLALSCISQARWKLWSACIHSLSLTARVN
jgi:lycopene cyclase domain-containing protein